MSAPEPPLNEIIKRIAHLVQRMMTFWESSHGWAPVEAASLLNKSMLDWQSSLAVSLKRWDAPLTDGDLILAWANVGALVEGQLKLFLSVYYSDYTADVDAIKKHGQVVDPDAVTLEPLRVFFKKKIWGPDEPWDNWICTIQQRRNAIHAFKFKHIGTKSELDEAIRQLLLFVKTINNRLPYPDAIYVPHELRYLNVARSPVRIGGWVYPYIVAVKVIDIFGNDTMTLVPVNVH